MVKVRGHSDDIIFVEGDIREEFGRFDSDGDYLAFSDGTLLHAIYDNEGIWRLKVIFKGVLYDEKIEGNVEEDTFDIVCLKDGIKWCVIGEELAK